MEIQKQLVHITLTLFAQMLHCYTPRKKFSDVFLDFLKFLGGMEMEYGVKWVNVLRKKIQSL